MVHRAAKLFYVCTWRRCYISEGRQSARVVSPLSVRSPIWLCRRIWRLLTLLIHGINRIEVTPINIVIVNNVSFRNKIYFT